MDQKKCNICGDIKPLDLFDRNKVSLDGRANRCKDCRKVYDDYKRNQLSNPTITPLDMCKQEKDKIGAIELLEAIGYKVGDKDNPVHSQFEKKMATKYGDK